MNSMRSTLGTVGEAMTPGVLTCTPDTELRDVARMMARYHVHAIVVFGPDQLAAWGVLSDLDLVGAIGTVSDAGTIAVLARRHGDPRRDTGRCGEADGGEPVAPPPRHLGRRPARRRHLDARRRARLRRRRRLAGAGAGRRARRRHLDARRRARLRRRRRLAGAGAGRRARRRHLDARRRARLRR